MSRISLRRQEASSRGVFVPDTSAGCLSSCSTCRGCGQPEPTVRLPDIPGDTAIIELPVTAQWQLLWHSWFKPLAAALLVAMGCAAADVSDGVALTLILAGFLAGCATCRQVPAAAMTLREETR